MPRDHYIAQTYLKEFIDSQTGMVHVHQKSGQYHPARTRDICFEMDGSNNSYFSEPRIIEEYLRVFEPRWTGCVAALQERRLDAEIKYIISGYIAFLRACNPTARRLQQANMEFILESIRPYEARNIVANHAQRDIENPAELVSALLDPRLRMEVDSEYTTAIGMQNLIASQKIYFRSPWMVVYNETDNPFITCDFPATYWYFRENYHIANVHFPITPNIAIHIMPAPHDIADEIIPPDQYGATERRRIKMFNRLVAQSAEKFVISNKREPWLPPLVSKYRNWRTESIHQHLYTPDGSYIINQLRVRERQ